MRLNADGDIQEKICLDSFKEEPCRLEGDSSTWMRSHLDAFPSGCVSIWMHGKSHHKVLNSVYQL